MSYPAYSGSDTTCPKCTVGVLDATFRANPCTIVNGQHSVSATGDEEHLCRRCQRCGYTTDEATADAT